MAVWAVRVYVCVYSWSAAPATGGWETRRRASNLPSASVKAHQNDTLLCS